MCPIVPTFTCGFDRSNFCWAIQETSSATDPFTRRGASPPFRTSPQDAMRAAGRLRAGPRASEASNPEIAPAKPALERRSTVGQGLDSPPARNRLRRRQGRGSNGGQSSAPRRQRPRQRVVGRGFDKWWEFRYKVRVLAPLRAWEHPTRSYADHQSARAEGSRGGAEEVQDARHGRLPAETRRLHPGLHDDPEEAELRAAQGRQGPPDQRARGHLLHSRGGP